MRADRLLSILMLLQARGRVTAQDLAEELEVSVRTIYRDIDALSVAGVPVYAERGPGGGCALVDGYRTNLTGLTEDEVRALFMLSIPDALADLGVGQELRAALLKLSAALPAARRRDEAWVRQRIHLDWTGGSRVEETVPHLQVIQRAAWEDRRLCLSYRLRYGSYVREFERVVAPYGLVARAGVWYLVCAGDGRIRVYRVSHLLDARVLDEGFRRPADWDLAAYWHAWRTGREEARPRYPVTVRVSPALAAELPQHLGAHVRDQAAAAGPPDAQGWITLPLSFESMEDARARILGLGGAVEVLEPLALRRSVQDFAAQTVALYAREGERESAGGERCSD